jgi:GTP-binding protein Era
VVSSEGFQIVLTDTPGFHKPRTLLGQRLNEMVGESVSDVDAAVLVVDAAAGVGRGDTFVAARAVQPLTGLKVCAVNKVDLLKRGEIVPQLEAAAGLAAFDHVIPVSAKELAGLEGQATDRALEHRIADIVREKALAVAREELPHSIATQIEEIEGEDGLVRIECLVLVERDSQKGIVIGKGGSMLKRIGTEARRELEPLLGEKVFLQLRVKVQKEWQRDPKALTRLGY